MKKALTYLLVAAMLIASFTGCATKAEPVVEAVEVAGNNDLSRAKDYIFTMYKDKAEKTTTDYKVVAFAMINGTQFAIDWSVDTEEVSLSVEAPYVIVDVNEKVTEDTYYNLKAVISDAEGNSEEVSFPHYIPGVPATEKAFKPVTAPAVGTYKFALDQANLGQTLYFAGEMNGSYLATTDNIAASVNVNVEEIEGGYAFSFNADGAKKYINIYDRGEGKAGVKIADEAINPFVWSADLNTFVVDIAGTYFYLGTYNTYNTISASDVKYISGDNAAKVGVSQFPAFISANYVYSVSLEGGVFSLNQANIGQRLYFAGEMNGSYLATTPNLADATYVNVEAIEGGYALSFDADGAKKYINIYDRGEGKAGVKIADEAINPFVWSADLNTFVVDIAGTYFYLGTYNTYNTISASDIKYIAGANAAKVGVSQFPAYVYAINNVIPAGKPAAGETYAVGLNQANIGSKLYLIGEMNGSYLATSSSVADAVAVSVEAIDGGYALSFVVDGAKKYMNIYDRGEGKAGVKIADEAINPFVWSDDVNTLVVDIAGTYFYLGTYNTYNTISASDIKYIAGDNAAKVGVSQFPIEFSVVTPVEF